MVIYYPDHLRVALFGLDLLETISIISLMAKKQDFGSEHGAHSRVGLRGPALESKHSLS